MTEQFTSSAGPFPMTRASGKGLNSPVSGGTIGMQPQIGARSTATGGGEQYTSSYTIGGSSMFGGAVKDSLRSFLDRRDQRILDLSMAPGEDNTSQLCWGGLNKNNPRGFQVGARIENRDSKDKKKEEPPTEKLYEWDEKERFVVKTKITNPEDKEQYIWADVVKGMLITAPSQEPFNSKVHFFKFNGKRTQVGVDEGGDEEDGDDEDDEEDSGGSPTPGPSPKSTGSGTTGPSGLGGSQPSGFGGG